MRTPGILGPETRRLTITPSDERNTTVADRQSMRTQELVRRTLLDEHGDFLKEAVAMVAAQLMEAEISSEVGAGLGEVSGERVTYRNGYRPRLGETRVGEIELAIPSRRSGEAYFPSFLEPRRRCEQAIVAVVMEASTVDKPKNPCSAAQHRAPDPRGATS